MNPRLRVEVGRQANFEYEISETDRGEPIWLGRGAFCKIRIADPQLSRRHCQFIFKDGQLFVEDLGSANGTKVNGEVIKERTQLKHGDRVTVGTHELSVIYPAASEGKKLALPALGTADEEQEAEKKAKEMLGKELAGYVLDEIIFSGQTSVVYRARDARGRPMAVKVLKQLSRITIEDQNRFIRGAKHSTVLRHPNFVRVYKGGRAGETYFLVMDFVEGLSLDRLVQQQGGPLDLGIALRIARQVLDALQHVYEQGLVYRAVRPDNIIVGDEHRIKLVDFDLIKPLTGRQEGQVTRVMDGSLRVEPSFAAPELIAYPVVADQKADVFGAGAVVYFMLCAKPPFSNMLPANKLSAAFERVAEDPRTVNPAVPEPICVIVKQSMSDYERYQTPGEMRDALDKAAAEAGL